MAEAAITPEPKKSNKSIIIIVLIVAATWFYYSKTHFLLGKDEGKADSTNIATSAPAVPTDSIKAVVPIDTTKKK